MTTERLDAIEASRRISAHYERYLRSTFQLSDVELRRELVRALNGMLPLVKGPFLQTVPPFAKGASVRILVKEGVLHPDFLRLPAQVVPPDRPLFAHQEEAIRKSVVSGRSLLVATGTGSGKTETFLFPILNHLFIEREKNTLGSGVRALLLYPMNALANDQIRRIRQLLAPFPEITFGRYVGDTPQLLRDAKEEFAALFPGEPELENELISREQMQRTPPHILLTNFSMLEYLLLRTADLRLFAQDPVTWKYLVLDEAHVYNGAKGTEVAMLLRRVKQRIFGSRRGEKLHCVATSATLGGPEDRGPMSQFASKLFGEEFEWIDGDDTRQDVVSATRVFAAGVEPATELPEDAYGRMIAALDSVANGAQDVVHTLRKIGGLADGSEGDAIRLSAEILLNDRRFIRFRAQLEREEVVDPGLLADKYFPTLGVVGIGDLVAVGARAQLVPGDAPVLAARYHLLLRALDGAYACLDAQHASTCPRIVLDASVHCPACAEQGRRARMFELAACRSCGASHLVGMLQQDGDHRILTQASPANFARHWFLLDAHEEPSEGEEDDDSTDSASSARPNDTPYWLCTRCGEVRPSSSATCKCVGSGSRSLLQLASEDEEGRIMKCRRCGSRHPAGVVARFESGADAPLTVIATDLFQSLPRDRALSAFVPGEGRKLLSFADSRQDAAYFASYLERTYSRGIERSLILTGLRALAAERGSGGVSLRDAASAVSQIAVREGVLSHDASHSDAERTAIAWFLSEVLSPDQRIGLEGAGLLRISVESSSLGVPPALLAAGLTADDATALLQVLIDVFRRKGAVAVPLGTSPDTLEFASTLTAMRLSGTTKGVHGWTPKTTNRQLEYLQRVIAKLELRAVADEILNGIWSYLTQETDVLVAEITKKDGIVHRLSNNCLRFELADALPQWRCTSCQRNAFRSVGGVCATLHCTGELEPMQMTDASEGGHYAAVYQELLPIPARIEEHTAQLETKTAARIQQDFTKGKVNILSCSTTFELGVDVGEVQAVLMRNVPPSPTNYVQRAGRAGRRADGAALVVTYAQRRNHDRYHFSQPLLLLKGLVRPPNIKLENPTIVRRHLHSVAFALFERIQNRRDQTVNDFFLKREESSETVHHAFVAWLATRPPDLLAALHSVLFDIPSIKDKLGLDSWAWADELCDTEAINAQIGWLTRAAIGVADDVSTIQAVLDEHVSAKRFRQADGLERLLNTIKGRELLGYLGSQNVLPKYGFPTDVVEFNLRTPDAAGNPMVGKLDLSRDLQIAIAEYAPGGQIMAAKQLWEGVGLRLRKDKALLEHAWMICESCGAFNDSLGESSRKLNCPVCAEPITGRGHAGTFVIPIFGFVGSPVPQKNTDARPKRAGFVEAFFSDYRGGSPDPARIRCGTNGAPIEIRTSQSGRITVLNRGPKARGFHLCTTCGYVGQVATKVKKTAKDHPIPGNSARRCTGMLRIRSLGHFFLTDVLEIAPALDYSVAAANSTLQAIVSGASSLGIPAEDIGGVLHAGSGGRTGFVLYDTVPGGAGHVTSLAQKVPQLLQRAVERVDGCSCGIDSSCYGCLRSYRNQRYHDQLTRRSALDVLTQLLRA